MKKSQGYVYIATIFDTKRAEIFYVKDLIKKAGLAVRTVGLTTQPGSLPLKSVTICLAVFLPVTLTVWGQ
ncbi:hypothetical protein [Photorhabdus antumapuensis]|uniref:hypothetical protein n=1 Tax=Photorhabdus antumapuensis TaxID=2862867 RepID=UPI001CED5695|nr:hypothetical protein [Photorhabdus antumapuensis]MCA6222536.1 hypothetical protein [Photorhabdus antumapuensis]